MVSGYRVQLEQFHGPMDLLLFLVRRNELAIEELRLAELTEQYLTHLERVEEVDVDRAGDYLVMAAQLLQLKARALLPELCADGAEELSALTPAALIGNLLVYRDLQLEVEALEALEAVAGRRWARTSARRVEELPLRHVDAWDLVTAYRRLLEQVGEAKRATRVVEADDEPLHLHVQRLRERVLACAEALRFEGALGEAPSPAARVSAFLALLELVRLHEVRVQQAGPFGEIHISRVSLAEQAALRADDAQDPRSSPDRSGEAVQKSPNSTK